MTDTSDVKRMTVYPVVLGYPHLFVPQKNTLNDSKGDEEDAKYSCELYIYQSNPRYQELWNTLQTGVAVAAKEKFGDKIPKFNHAPIKLLTDKENWAGEPGFWIRAKSKTRPRVSKKDPGSPNQSPIYIDVTDEEDAYPGIICCASVTAYGYDGNKNKGVGFFINQVLLLKDGARLGRPVKSAAEEFGGIAGQLEFGDINGGMPDMSSAGMGLPPMPQMPPMPGAQTQLPPQYQQPNPQYAQMPYNGVPPQYPGAPAMYPPQQQAYNPAAMGIPGYQG